jgi:hypothetical protein
MSGLAQRLDFGMISAELTMITSAGDLTVFDNDGANHGIGADEPKSGRREFQGFL